MKVARFKRLTIWLIFLWLVASGVRSRLARPLPHCNTVEFTDELTQVLGSGVETLDVSISKELSGIASAGGMGVVVRELAVLSLEMGHSSAVIMPRYRGLTSSRYMSCVTFQLKTNIIVAAIHHAVMKTSSGVVHVFLVDYPKQSRNKWPHVDGHLYELTKGQSWQTRDLFFSLVAAHIVKQLEHYVARFEAHRRVLVQVHGVSNAPSIVFMRLLTNASILYRAHDYMDEVRLAYDYDMVKDYIHSVAPCHPCASESNRLWAFCEGTGLIRVPCSAVGTFALHSDVFFACADTLSPVSHAMLSYMMTSETSFHIFQRLAEEKRIMPVGHWVSEPLEMLARQLQDKAHGSISLAKVNAAQKLFQTVNKKSYRDIPTPTIMWIGRFEVNKGLSVLPSLSKFFCKRGLNFVVVGNYEQSALLKEVIRLRRSMTICMSSNMLLIPSSQHPQVALARLAADIMIIPSKEEAYGLTAAEALIFGALPIVTNVGGLTEIIESSTLEDLTCDTLRQATFTGKQVMYVEDVATLTRSFAFAVYEAVKLLQSLHVCGLQEKFVQRLSSAAQVRPSVRASHYSTVNYEAFKKVLIATRTNVYPSHENGKDVKFFTTCM